MKRVRVIEVFNWTTGMAGARSYAMAPLLLQSLAAVVNFTNYQHFSYDSITVRLTANTTQYYKGLLGVHFVPGRFLSTHMQTPHGLTQFSSCYIDASSTEVLEMVLPWVIATKKTDSVAILQDTGSLIIYPHVPISSDSQAGASVSVSLTVEAWFNNPVLYDQSGPGSFPVPTLAPTTFAISDFVRIQCQSSRQTQNEAAKKSEKGALTQVAETTAAISGKLTTLPVVGSIAAGINVVASAAASVFAWFGLSKPTAVATPQYVVQQDVPYTNTFHGISMAQPMSTNLQPYVSSEPELVVSKDDELSVYNIARTPSLLDYVTIPTSAVFGTLLFSTAVNPMEFFAGASLQRFGSHLGYAASFFTAWTGDICYKIVLTSTKFQTVRIAVVWSPIPLTTYSEDLRQEKYDITGSCAIDMLVPWAVKFPYRSMRVPNNSDTNLNMSNGFFGIYCLAPIVNNTAATATPINGMLFSAAGTSLRFASYRSPCLTSSTYSPQIYSSSKAQGSFGATSLGLVAGVIDEDNIVSLREIAHRRSFLIPWISSSGPLSFSLYDPVTNTTNLAYILRKFRYWRGSLILAIQSNEGTGQFTISRGLGTAWELAQCRVNVTTTPDGEFCFPFLTTQGTQVTGAMNWYSGDSTPTSVSLSMIGTTSTTCKIFVSASDDLSCGVMLCSPIISGNYTY